MQKLVLYPSKKQKRKRNHEHNLKWQKVDKNFGIIVNRWERGLTVEIKTGTMETGRGREKESVHKKIHFALERATISYGERDMTQGKNTTKGKGFLH